MTSKEVKGRPTEGQVSLVNPCSICGKTHEAHHVYEKYETKRLYIQVWGTDGVGPHVIFLDEAEHVEYLPNISDSMEIHCLCISLAYKLVSMSRSYRMSMHEACGAVEVKGSLQDMIGILKTSRLILVEGGGDRYGGPYGGISINAETLEDSTEFTIACRYDVMMNCDITFSAEKRGLAYDGGVTAWVFDIEKTLNHFGIKYRKDDK
jgi:hypothetical protein